MNERNRLYDSSITYIRSACYRLLALIMVAIVLCVGVLYTPSVSCAATSTGAVYDDVETAYGSGFPLSDSNMIKVDRKNIFGKYSVVMGVSAKYFSQYTAAQKSNSSEEYMCFICKAVSKKAVKKIKSSMKKYVINEYNGNINYHSDLGNQLLKNARVGSKGKYVYLFVLDTDGNKKAISAFKESLS